MESRAIRVGRVKAVDDKILCEPQEISGPAAVWALLESVPSKVPKTMCVRDSKILDDLEICLEDDLYRGVFRDDRIKRRILDAVAGASIPEETIAEFRLLAKVDSYSYRHILMVTALATRMALDFSYEDAALGFLISACLTHDYGKSRISREILCSNAFLTEDEIQQIKAHPITSCLLARYYFQEDRRAEIALVHHERMDGTGYPFSERLLDREVRLIQVCDMFDALISPRSFRQAPFRCREALDYLIEEALAGSVDGDVVKLLVSYVRAEATDWRSVRLYKGRTSILGKQGTYRHIR